MNIRHQKRAPIIGYHASHEQFSPSELLGFVDLAKKYGFTSFMCSDHFHPWSTAQGQSGFAWSWLGAAQTISPSSFGVVTCPIGRYPPAVIAQASATLAEMSRDRFWLAVGTGEALNENITGKNWPDKVTRQAALLEAVTAVRALWRGETVNIEGLVTVRNARLYTLPKTPPLLFAAALSSQTAYWAGSWADGLITTSGPIEEMNEIRRAFFDGGGRGKPIYLQSKVSYDVSEDAALSSAMEQWRCNLISSDKLAELSTPLDFERASIGISANEMLDKVRISSDIRRHSEWLRNDIEAGYDAIYIHNVNKYQRRFISDFGSEVISNLKL
jgi:coenzyme F420-dependent glucose-6-phosphate dehydrogenase